MQELTLSAFAPFTDPDHAALKALPSNSPSGRARDLLSALTRPDFTQGSAAERMVRLQQLDENVRKLLTPLLAEAHASELSSAPGARRAAQLAQHLVLGVHNGFKQVALELSREAGRFFNRRPALEAVDAALASAWELVAICARTYTPLPAGFWIDCHRIFSYIDEQGWMSKSAGKDASLGDLYGRIMLLGMTGSNRMELPKIELLIAFISERAPELEFKKLKGALGEQGAFLFRVDLDQPGRFFDELARAEAQAAWWVVDVSPITREMPKRIAALQAKEGSSPHELQLLTGLLREWANPPKRRHARTAQADAEEVELVSLLPGCWLTLHAESGKAPITTWGVALEQGEDADDALGAPPPARLRVCNMSESGMMLEGESANQPLRSGGLILVRRKAHSWQLGIVRWVSFRSESLETQCGVELIGRKPDPVLVMPVMSHPTGRYQRALSLMNGRRLVMGGRFYQPMREFHIADGEKRLTAKASTLALQVASYQMFDVKLGDEVDDEPGPAAL